MEAMIKRINLYHPFLRHGKKTIRSTLRSVSYQDYQLEDQLSKIHKRWYLVGMLQCHL
ncbi:conserved hypothetical protein [Ricinus communis]|uniref:Uncharacterized protein n=1 Tax=Ricinus communis TaxID=3988 RepID=B9S9P0_RICCO|nr:conserved hypothetical protein [Ricinus communis]